MIIWKQRAPKAHNYGGERGVNETVVAIDGGIVKMMIVVVVRTTISRETKRRKRS